jgi:nickel superoxide dismutase
MVLRMQNLEHPAPGSEMSAHQAFANTFNRYVQVKEEHAEKCKEELRILWADYAWPNTDAAEIAAKFNAAIKLAGQCKQTVSMENAKALVAAVDEIATIFWSTKGVEYSDPVAEVRFGA